MNWYDAVAAGYDELRGDEQRKKFKVFDEYIDEDMRVVDVGFGTGLSDAYFDAEIVGVEPNQSMLSEYEGDADTLHAGAEEIDSLFSTGSFDAALCVSTAHHFDDPRSVFARISTVLRPAGYLCLSVFQKDAGLVEDGLDGFEEKKRCHVHRDTVVVYQAL